MKLKLKIVGITAAIIVIAGIIILIFYLNNVQNYRDKVASLTFDNIDLSEISDGTYVGECNVDFIYAKVEVSVKDGFITDINLLEHKNDRGKPAETIINDIMKEQSLDVDTVSGATNSSKVIIKAVENALLNGAQ